MPANDQLQQTLRQLPGVDHLMATVQKETALAETPKAVLVRAIRETLENLRRQIIASAGTLDQTILMPANLVALVTRRVTDLQAFNMKRTINATGVVVHTNLGRSLLAREAIDHVVAMATRYSNLEFNLEFGRRGSRYSAVEDLLCELTGAEAALAVNNNAGAVLLSLDTLARNKEVVISRGELVEIGGSFRIPDVMAKSGAILREVGTTNRTHLRDYENAITTETGLLLKVHSSNFSIVGFTAAVGLEEMVALGKQFHLPVMEDLGSGNLIDLARYGLDAEPTVQASVLAGVDVVTFSGDKLLGGPQAGLIVGKRAIVERIKANPLTRALRIDKMTLAGLEATLRLYRDEPSAIRKIPTLRMLLSQRPEIERRAHQLAQGLKQLGKEALEVELFDMPSRAGGGALPLLALPSCCVGVAINGQSTNRIENAMRRHEPPIIGRIENDRFIMDPRTIQDDEVEIIVKAFEALMARFER